MKVMCTLISAKSINQLNSLKYIKVQFLSNKFLVSNKNQKNYLIAINKIKYRKRVEVIAKAERGKIRPVFNHLKNLIFLLTTFATALERYNLKLFKA